MSFLHLRFLLVYQKSVIVDLVSNFNDTLQSQIVVIISVTRFSDLLDFGQLLKPLATINLPQSPLFLGNFCKGVKIFNISSEIIFG